MFDFEKALAVSQGFFVEMRSAVREGYLCYYEFRNRDSELPLSEG